MDKPSLPGSLSNWNFNQVVVPKKSVMMETSSWLAIKITVKGKWRYMLRSWEFLGVKAKLDGMISLSKYKSKRFFLCLRQFNQNKIRKAANDLVEEENI